MTSQGTFLLNLAFFQRFNAEKAQVLLTMPQVVSTTEKKKLDEAWLNFLLLQEPVTVFVYGIGDFAEEYVALRPWLKQQAGRTLVFLVNDLAVLRAFLEKPIALELLTDPQVILHSFYWPTEGCIQDLKPQFEWFFKTFATGKSIFISRYASSDVEINQKNELEVLFKSQFDEWLRTYRMFLVSHAEVLGSYYANFLELLNAHKGQGLFGSLPGMPAIICGAGPSLETQLDDISQLVDKALIFGAGSGVNVLSRHGITSHFGGGVDPTATQVSRLSTHFAFELPYFYLNRFNHDALKFLRGEKLFTCGGISLKVGDWFEEQLCLGVSARVPTGMSTSNYCLEIACLLGCNPIILVGMDLCYHQSIRYGEGVSAHPAEERQHHVDLSKPKLGLIKAKNVNGMEVTTSKDWLLEAESFTDCRRRYPDRTIVNASLGGLAIADIPHQPFQEYVQENLTGVYAIDTIVHELIQKNNLDFITREKLDDVFIEWSISLARCKKALVQRLAWLQSELAALSQEKKDLPIDYFRVDLSQLLEKTPAFTYCLEQLNDIFDGLNGKEYFRMAHFPESYPTWKNVHISGVIEVERCKFLLEKLDLHLRLCQKAHAEVANYPQVPRSHSTTFVDPLVEKIEEEGERLLRFRYCGGELYALKRFEGDKLHGKQEFYYANGQLKTLMHYQQGRLHGIVQLHHFSGQLLRELYFVEGKLEGSERWWNAAGVLVRECHYLANQPTGKCFFWHDNGVLAREITYIKWPEHYEMMEWDEQGRLR